MIRGRIVLADLGRELGERAVVARGILLMVLGAGPGGLLVDWHG